VFITHDPNPSETQMKLICPSHCPSPLRVRARVCVCVCVFSKKREGSFSTSAQELSLNSVSRVIVLNPKVFVVFTDSKLVDCKIGNLAWEGLGWVLVCCLFGSHDSPAHTQDPRQGSPVSPAVGPPHQPPCPCPTSPPCGFCHQ